MQRAQFDIDESFQNESPPGLSRPLQGDNEQILRGREQEGAIRRIAPEQVGNAPQQLHIRRSHVRPTGGYPLDEILIKRPCVLRVGNISDDMVRNFCMNYLLKWTETYLTCNPQAR